MKHWKPIFVEESKVPALLSFFAPIEIRAITLGCVVFSRDVLPVHVRRHETIHFQQFLETLFLPFVLIYLYDYVRNRLRFKDARTAYKTIRAEREAYLHAGDPNYLAERKRYRWLLKE